MKYLRLFTINAVIAFISFKSGHLIGSKAARRDIPSCIYINRNSASAKPWGRDGKVGVDVTFDEIDGGGYYVDTWKWKEESK